MRYPIKVRVSVVRQVVSLGIVACVIVTQAQAQTYETLGNVLKAGVTNTPGFNSDSKDSPIQLSESFLFYLKLQGLDNPRTYAGLAVDVKELIQIEYKAFTTRCQQNLEARGLLNDPAWKSKLAASEQELTPFGLWFALFLEDNPVAKPEYSLPLLQKLTDANSDLLKNPLSIHQAVAVFFERNRVRDDAGLTKSVVAFNAQFLSANDPSLIAAKSPTKKLSKRRQQKLDKVLPPLPSVVTPTNKTPLDFSRAAQMARAAITGRVAAFNGLILQKIGEIKLQRFLGDSSALNRAYRQERKTRDLATELAVARTLAASLEANPSGGDPVLKAKLERVTALKAKMEAQISSHQAKRDEYRDLKGIYDQAVRIAQSEKSLQKLVQANSEVVLTLQLKFAKDLLETVIGKIHRLIADADQGLVDNARNSQDLGGRKAWARERLSIAQSYLARAQGGEFTDAVQHNIDKINETVRGVSDLITNTNMDNIIRDGNSGNLTAPFRDIEYVNNEIATWEDALNQFNTLHAQAEQFIDVDRKYKQFTQDELGDSHPVAAPLWTEFIKQELEQSQVDINLAVNDFERIKDLKDRMKTDPNAYYIGVKDNYRQQASSGQVNGLILRREGRALLSFGEAVIKYKIAESTLNALENAYRKDAAFQSDFPDAFPEPFYDTTLTNMEQAKARAHNEILPKILRAFDMEGPLLIQLGVSRDKLDELVTLVQRQFQSEETGGAVPVGYAHRGFALADSGKRLAEETLAFLRQKQSILSSGNATFQDLLPLIGQQLAISQRQLDFAQQKLLPFLNNYMMPAAQSETSKWEGFIKLYEQGYGLLYDAKAEYYQTERDGFNSMKDFLNGFLGPINADYNNIVTWLANLNPKEDPAIRRQGRALSEIGDEMLERLKKKKYMIHALEALQQDSLDASDSALRRSLEELNMARNGLDEALSETDPDDPNRVKALELLLEGDMFQNPSENPSDTKNQPAFFIRKSAMERILTQGSLAGGQKPTVNDWIASLGLNDYEVFPVGSDTDSFYVVVHYGVGVNPAAVSDPAVRQQVSTDAFAKFGNIGKIAGGNVSVSIYDWKDLEPPPHGVRGVRLTHERDQEDERLINTTVLDIHQFLQQGEVMRIMLFENLAVMVLDDRLFIGLTGYGDLPTSDPGGEDKGMKAPYTVGGRAKSVLYLNEVMSVNAEVLRVFAKDPSELVKEVSLSLDPCPEDPTKPCGSQTETITVEGKVLNYIKKHAGVNFDLAKLFSNKQTLALEFYMEEEHGTDYDERVWKGGKLIKEIHLKVFGEPMTLRTEAKYQVDQNGNSEPSGSFAFYFPKGIILEARGARYEGQTTGKAAIRKSMGSGAEIFASYGNDRIESNPKIMFGAGYSMTSDQIRQQARARVEEAATGGATLDDFNEQLDQALKPSDPAKTPTNINDALYHALNHDSNVANTKFAIGTMEQDATDLQKVLKWGVGVTGGYVIGTGYKNPLTCDKDGKNCLTQSGYGFDSTAGGIQVGGQIWLGLTQQEKEKAYAQIVKIKSVLIDLKQAYEEGINEFRLNAFKVVLARLRLAQLRLLMARDDIANDPVFQSKLRVEESTAKTELALAQSLLRMKAGLGPKDALPGEIEDIPIDPGNPQRTLEALSLALEFKDGWRNFLKTLAETDPEKTARPNLANRALAAVSPLQILPFVDEIGIDLGSTIWDSLGNSFFGVGASLKVSFYNPEKTELREAAIFDGKVTDLELLEKVRSQKIKDTSYSASFDQWSLDKQRVILENYAAVANHQFQSEEALSGKLTALESLNETLRDLSRVYLERLEVPKPAVVASATEKVALGDVAALAQQGQAVSATLQALAMKQEMAKKMEEAGKDRWRWAVRLGARFNPITNYWFESATVGFTNWGLGRLVNLELNLKSKGISEKEQQYAKALGEASRLDGELTRLDIARQIAESYTRLFYGLHIKDELVRKIEANPGSAQAAKSAIELLELRRLMEREALKLTVMLGYDPAQKIVDVSALSQADLDEVSRKIRTWFRDQMKDAPELEFKALEARLQFVEALEAKARQRAGSRDFSTDPIGFGFQLAAELVQSLFAKDGGESVSAPGLASIVQLRQQLETEYRNWNKNAQDRKQWTQARLEARQRAYTNDPTVANRLEVELANLSLASRLNDPKVEPKLNIPSFDRAKPRLGKIQGRYYIAQEPQVNKESGYYTKDTLKDVSWREGIVQILLRQPNLVDQRYLVQAEVLEQYKEAHAQKLKQELLDSRFRGLLWKHRYLSSKLANQTDNNARARIAKLIEETEQKIKMEFGKEPKDYPTASVELKVDNLDSASALTDVALRYVTGDAPVLDVLKAQIAQGRLQSQSIIDNLKSNAMNPSFVFGYLRGGYVAGGFLSTPSNGPAPNADLSRDLRQVFAANFSTVLQTHSLIEEARERLLANHLKAEMLSQNLAETVNYMEQLKAKMEENPQDVELVNLYYQAFEDSLNMTSELHALYLNLETDLRMLGRTFPKTLGRSKQEPWAVKSITSKDMSYTQALAAAKALRGALAAAWRDADGAQRKRLIHDWLADLESRVGALSSEEQKRIGFLSGDITKGGLRRLPSQEKARGVLIALDDVPGKISGHVIAGSDWEDLKAGNRVFSYETATGQLIVWNQDSSETDPSRRILVAPVGFTGAPPKTIAEAARANFLEFVPTTDVRARELEEVRLDSLRAQENTRQQQDYHQLSDPFALYGANSERNTDIRVLYEDQAIAAARSGNLKLLQKSTGNAIDLNNFSHRAFWKKETMDIYLGGDYQFVDGNGHRTWTYEELVREGRLIAFEHNLISGEFKRVQSNAINPQTVKKQQWKLDAYFGEEPSLLVDVASAQDLKEYKSDVLEMVFTEKGDQFLQDKTKHDIAVAWQAGYVYLKTSYGFSLKANGALDKVYLSQEEFDKAEGPKSQLYKTSDLLLELSSAGRIVKVKMTNVEGKTFDHRFSSAPATRTWGDWVSAEVDNEFNVKKLYRENELEDGFPKTWSVRVDRMDNPACPQGLCPLEPGLFPGFSRNLEYVNPKEGTTVLFASKKLAKEVEGSRSDLAQVQAKPWLYTARFVAGTTVASIMPLTSLTLPLVVGVGGANTAGRVAALKGEGSMQDDHTPLYDLADFALLWMVIPKAEDKINDQGDYPQTIKVEHAPWYTHIPIVGRIFGTTRDKLDEVNAQTVKTTGRTVELGEKALERTLAWRQEDYNGLRDKIVARFSGGLALRETKYPFASSYYPDTHVQVITGEQAYRKAVDFLESVGVRFASDGSFAMDILPSGSVIEGTRIEGIGQAQDDLSTLDQDHKDHEVYARMLTQSGGVAKIAFGEGKIKDQILREGAPALEDWRARLQGLLKQTSQAAYDPKLDAMVDTHGRWLFKTNTHTLVFFDEMGQVSEVDQAVLAPQVYQENLKKEEGSYQFVKNYPGLLAQGGVLHVDGQGNTTGYELGQVVAQGYLNRALGELDPSKALEAIEKGYVFDRPDQGKDILLFSAPSKN